LAAKKSLRRVQREVFVALLFRKEEKAVWAIKKSGTAETEVQDAE